jgi:hypothetical protein
VSALADRVVHVLSNACDLVFLLSERERVADGNISLEFAGRMLDNHLGEVRMSAFIEQNNTVVGLEELARQLADSRDGTLILYIHI